MLATLRLEKWRDIVYITSYPDTYMSRQWLSSDTLRLEKWREPWYTAPFSAFQ